MGDELVVETIFNYHPGQKNARIELLHLIFKKMNNVPVVEGSTVLGICNRQYEMLYRIPDEIKGYINEKLELNMSHPAPGLKIRKW